MMEDDRLFIQVPGSTANLGPGFDSIGLALNLYLSIEVEKSNSWEVVMLSEELEVFSTDESNFVIQVALETAQIYNRHLPPCRLEMKSEIPLTRGLGSSAAAIVAGIELADQLGNLKLSKEEKLKLASQKEGHPDNVGASLLGGMVIGSQEGIEVDYVGFNSLQFDVIAVVPEEELLTKASREVLPKEMPFHQAVKAGAVSNVLIAALLSGNYELAGKMMTRDLYHQPYRKKIVPHLEDIEQTALQAGAFGVALSGAGPTVICCIEKGQGPILSKKLAEQFPKMNILSLSIDQAGSKVYKESCVK